MQTLSEKNKAVVRRFNEEFLVKKDLTAFEEIVAPDFINHTAPNGNGDRIATRDFILQLLHPAMPDLQLEIFDMIAEDDKVVTHKAFTGTLSGPFMGHAATGKKATLRIIDIVQLKDGLYKAHWSIREMITL
ncbi:ester cyclase [Chitinophaga arvensicola]|uniref:SnoaL-like polyketide cyclase n=1 Tax=Chitinophaga arvensicola TaxID=29529 RepID=A0A1I0QUN0_9BACT|nr:ester cyclase [Chitinophaga arvensicola]SEW31150.1 SnoaL-like polyketide cyclase [Chitinophaga arvensicola]